MLVGDAGVVLTHPAEGVSCELVAGPGAETGHVSGENLAMRNWVGRAMDVSVADGVVGWRLARHQPRKMCSRASSVTSCGSSRMTRRWTVELRGWKTWMEPGSGVLALGFFPIVPG